MGLKYVGKGSLPGVPARDLTDQEVKQFGEKQLLASGLYIKIKSSKPNTKEAMSDGRD